MKFITRDPLTWILLVIGFVLLIISGILGTVASTNIQVDRIQLNSNGVAISALLLYPSETNIQRPAILAYHGWGGTKESILTTSLDFAKAGYVVLIPDLRGHGESGGVSTLGLAEQTDAKVAVDYLFSRPDLVNSSALAVWGASFGGMIVLLAAGNDSRIVATIAISAPSNTTSWLEERDFRTNERISYRPYALIDPSNKTAIEERSPINHVNNIENLLVMHGKLDPLVPVHHAEDLIKASNNSDHKLIIFPEGEHNLDGDIVKKETTQFLKHIFANPHINITGTTVSYFFLMTGWITLLLGGMASTMGTLSSFPLIQQIINLKWNTQKSIDELSSNELSPFISVLSSLVLLLLSFIVLHILSVLISLVTVMYYSTLLGLTLSTLSTIVLFVIGSIKLREGKLKPPSSMQLKKWAVEAGITLLMILIIYSILSLIADQQWIPFINLKTAVRLSAILIGIAIFLGVESFFYWNLVYSFVTRLIKNKQWYWIILSMSSVYLISKCTLFFGLIIWWNLFEIRFIIYGLGLFGLLGGMSAFIRLRWGFHSTLAFTIIVGLTLYSSFSVLFLLL